MNPIITHEEIVACDGKNRDKNATSCDKIGHPKVYIHVNSKDVVDCPYCSRSFAFKPKPE